MRIFVLEVSSVFEGIPFSIYPVLLKSKDRLILVDCGYEGFAGLLEAAANRQGFSLQNLTDIVITHHDIDHIGALAELKLQFPQIAVHSTAFDKPYIEGIKPSLRLQQAEALFGSLPEEEKPKALVFQDFLRSVKPVPVDGLIALDEPLQLLPGIFVVHTPGHMPGHISLYAPETKTLISGDGVVLRNGQLSLAHPKFTLDIEEAIQSVRKLSRLKPERIICYHGGLLENNVGRRLQELINQYANHIPELAASLVK